MIVSAKGILINYRMPFNSKQKPEIIHAMELAFKPHWHAPVHRHPDFEELLVITEGHIRLRWAAKEYEGGSGMIVFYPRNTEHVEFSIGDKEVRMLLLAWRHHSRAEILHIPPVSWNTGGHVVPAIRWLIDMRTRQRNGAEEMCRCLLRTLVFELANSFTHPEDERITRAKTFLRNHLAEEIRLDDVAQAACMSKSHFEHFFHKSSGTTPMRFLQNARIDAAWKLLLTTCFSLSAIAERTGFGNAYHFARVFRKLKGTSPSFVRKSALGVRSPDA